jgi:hypothetical protein
LPNPKAAGFMPAVNAVPLNYLVGYFSLYCHSCESRNPFSVIVRSKATWQFG